MILVPQQYSSTAQILIDPRDRQILTKDVIPTRSPPTAACCRSKASRASSNSDAVLLRAVKTLGLDHDPEYDGSRLDVDREDARCRARPVRRQRRRPAPMRPRTGRCEPCARTSPSSGPTRSSSSTGRRRQNGRQGGTDRRRDRRRLSGRPDRSAIGVLDPRLRRPRGAASRICAMPSGTPRPRPSATRPNTISSGLTRSS